MTSRADIARGCRRRCGWLVLAVLLGLVGPALGLTPPPAASAASSGEFAGRLEFALSQISPVVVTAEQGQSGSGGDAVTVTGSFTNTGPDLIDDFWFRFQRGPALTTLAEVEQETANPTEPTEVVNSDFRPLGGLLQPGDSRPFAITVPAFGDPADTLAVTKPGVYPVMLNINATVHTAGGTTVARVGELHVLVTVGSVPGGAGPAGPTRTVSVLWPLVDRPHLAVGGVFRDDDLAESIAPGGRLRTALDAVSDLPTHTDPNLVTLVVDPMVLDELDRMSGGYRVLADPSRQVALRPGRDPRDGAVAGAGSADAYRFLTDLRALAATHRVVSLPYGDADVTALARAGATDLLRDAIFRGRDIATRVLVRGPLATEILRHLVTSVALPPGGVLTPEAAAVLADMGDDGLILADGAAADPDGEVLRGGMAAVAVAPATDAPATDASGHGPAPSMRAVVAGGRWAGEFAAMVTAHGSGSDHAAEPDGPPTSLWDSPLERTAMAAELAVTSQGLVDPIVVLPDGRFTPDPSGLAALADLVSDFSASGMLVPASISQVFEHVPDVSAELAPPANARAAELPLRYVQQLLAQQNRVDVLRRALAAAPDGPDPREVLGPLKDAALPAVSSAWRGVSEPDAAGLATVDATLTLLFGGVQIARDTGSYTLASSTAPLLLTVQNSLPYEVTLGMGILGGGQSGLTATDPGTVTVGAGPRSLRVTLDTEVSRSGTFRVYAQLTGPDGVTWGPPVPITIDSRAYGPLTLILMFVGGGVLLLMVVWRIVQRIRGRATDPANALVEPPSPEVPEASSPDQPTSSRQGRENRV